MWYYNTLSPKISEALFMWYYNTQPKISEVLFMWYYIIPPIIHCIFGKIITTLTLYIQKLSLWTPE